ncbi:hypothetical protein GIB67_007550 [Kingdonia uniflora]|uniref:Uncharacterized protein n=1 Tax=Kingdonia uniflora TaxID=39325 RepID=A0A7J7LNF6_9MAGN|nr:hypothetical protein GIB67_007550 [Kingdonia uniflora]
MGIHLPSMALHAKQILKLKSILTRNQLSPVSTTVDVSKDELRKSLALIIHGLTIACRETAFIALTSCLNNL